MKWPPFRGGSALVGKTVNRTFRRRAFAVVEVAKWKTVVA